MPQSGSVPPAPVILSGPLVPAASGGQAAPTATPLEETSVRLTVIGTEGKDDPAFDFITAPAGPPVVHVFTLRNDTRSPVVLDHLESACDCTSAILLGGTQGAQPRLLPGVTARVRVTLDTSKLAPPPAGTPGADRVDGEVSVFLAGQTVHPAAVLRLTGRLTRGVAFDPPALHLDAVDEAAGTTRFVRVTYDAGLYAPGKTRLAAAPDGRLTVRPLAGGPDARPTATGQVRKTYRVTVPPHAAIGPLSGVLAVTGLAGSPDAASLPAAFVLPYAGDVRGRVAAEPGMAVFGLVSRRDPAGLPAAPAEARSLAVRWILLLNPALATPAKPTPGTHVGTGAAAAAFWREARVRVDLPFFAVSLVPPADPRKAAPSPAPARDAAPPDVSAAHLAPGTYSWLRVGLLPAAPAGQSLSGRATVRFPDGETVLLPIQAQVR